MRKRLRGTDLKVAVSKKLIIGLQAEKTLYPNSYYELEKDFSEKNIVAVSFF